MKINVSNEQLKKTPTEEIKLRNTFCLICQYEV